MNRVGVILVWLLFCAFVVERCVCLWQEYEDFVTNWGWLFCQTFLGLGGWLFCLSSWLCCVVPCGLVAGQGKHSWHLTMCRRNADVRFKSTILCYLFILCFLHKYFQNVVKFFCRSKFEQITPLNDLVIWLFLVHVTVCTRLHCLMLRSSGLGTSHC